MLYRIFIYERKSTTGHHTFVNSEQYRSTLSSVVNALVLLSIDFEPSIFSKRLDSSSSCNHNNTIQMPCEVSIDMASNVKCIIPQLYQPKCSSKCSYEKHFLGHFFHSTFFAGPHKRDWIIRGFTQYKVPVVYPHSTTKKINQIVLKISYTTLNPSTLQKGFCKHG